MHFTSSAGAVSGDPIHLLPQYAGLDVHVLVPDSVAGSLDIAFARVTVPAGGEIPTSSSAHPQAMYVLSGSARVWRAGTSVEVFAPAALYVPAGEPVALRTLGETRVDILVAFARGGDVKSLSSQLLEDDALLGDTNPSEMPFGPIIKRWAATPDSFGWEAVESTKGMRLRCNYLLDGASGTDDFVAGLAIIEPRTHYTIHRHEPPEIYYVLKGTARIYVGDEAFDVSPGDTDYVPSFAPHGVDTNGETLEMYWFYATDQVSTWTWEPLEPIYPNPPRRPLETGPRRGFHTHS